MRRLLFAALLLLCCAYGCIAKTEYRSPYPPDPDLEVFPETDESETWGTRVANIVPKEGDKVGQWQNIRIAVNPAMMQSEMMYCLTKGRQISGYTRRIRNGFDREVCKVVRRIGAMRLARRVMLGVMPKAIELHVERLKVKRVEGPLRINVSSNPEPISDAEGTMCAEMVPVFDGDEGMGIPNADFVIYLGLSTKNPGTKICTYDRRGRPTSAMIKLNPSEIEFTPQYIRLVAHEIAHGLGFSMDVKKFKEMVRSEDRSSFVGYRDLRSSKIMESVYELFGCLEAIGIKLDNSPPESENDDEPHFGGSAVQDELMAPLHRTRGGKRLYSTLTLAAFESTGHYQVDYNKAEKLWEGKKACVYLKVP
ncbi:putative surface protease GP63 [Trypanosoma theileri]|uniref:Leishmanolysin-like peptidase n=1 Tax=Trypanosoma theileri TaxID=67003 RepID=A0A1X0NXK4_9TRYP|nr:putative surface protease GP63 [Trypanosoma theileri]ORC89412.1 putative surface protease GP63 [Trypanosoma theileri]